jgi:hypothetical protein
MLTKAQIEQRQGKLTASRVACLMTGDAEKILRLYKEMIGEEDEEDLSRVWPVALGVAAEQLQLVERAQELIPRHQARRSCRAS